MAKTRRPSKTNTRAKRQAKAKAARESRRETIATRAAERRLDELFGSEVPPRRSAEIMLERLEGDAVPAGVSRFFALAGSVEQLRLYFSSIDALALEGACTAIVGGLLDQASRREFARLTGRWPGRKAKS